MVERSVNVYIVVSLILIVNGENDYTLGTSTQSVARNSRSLSIGETDAGRLAKTTLGSLQGGRKVESKFRGELVTKCASLFI